MTADGDRKSTGNNFGCTLRCEFSHHSFSQSSSDGTVTFTFAKGRVAQMVGRAFEPAGCEVFQLRGPKLTV
jgi:hypothetical protein